MRAKAEPIAVITGSTGGIGSAVTSALAQRSWHLVLVNRSQAKADRQRNQVLAAYPHVAIKIVTADLMDINEIEEACAQISSRLPRIDALYNLAGVLTDERRLSAQRHESHYAVNVLANYAMIQGLRGALRREDNELPAMVVTMSSSAIERAKPLDVMNLRDPPEIGGLMGAYAQSKLALTAMGAAMAPQLLEDGILLRSIDPGATRTSMTLKGEGMPTILRWLAPLLFAKPDHQAYKIIDAADPEEFDRRSGVYISSGEEKELPSAIRCNRVAGSATLALLSRDYQAAKMSEPL